MSIIGETRIPHSLRLAAFFLRVALGLDFFYLGWSSLFNHPLAVKLGVRSAGGMYLWLASPAPFAGVPTEVFAWIFLIVGVLLAIGLFTRLAAIVAGVLVVVSWLPGVSFAAWNPVPFVNDDIVIFFSLIIIILTRAGTYIGIDKFVHWSRKHHKE